MQQKEVLIILVVLVAFAVFFMNNRQNSGDSITGEYKGLCPGGYTYYGECSDEIDEDYSAADSCSEYCRINSRGLCIGGCTDRVSRKLGMVYDCECYPLLRPRRLF